MPMKLNIVNITFISALCLILMHSCVNSPDFTTEPKIEFLEFEKDTVAQQEAFTYKFRFEDGDGDLGEAETSNIFLIDLRQNDLEMSGFPKIPEQGAGNGVEGVATINFNGECCVYDVGPPCDWAPNSKILDTVVYELYIVDRAGNESNRVKTDTLYIRCDQ